MTSIKENSELYNKIFKNESIPETFQSRFPSYEEIANGFLDPSNQEIILSKNKLNGDQTGDIRNMSRILLKDLSLNLGDSNPINFPSMLIDGMFNVIKSTSIGTSLTDSDVIDTVMSASKYDSQTTKIGGVPGLLIGGALLSLSVTVPLVGTIASAIVGIATGIAKAVKTNSEKKNIEEEKNRALLYKTFPPLQVAGSGTDSSLVETARSILISKDWTNIWRPRFKGKDWRGQERVGGFAFAPGSVLSDSSEFAADVDEKFNPSGGFGVIPGTNIVTSVIQVSISHDPADPYSAAFQKYMTKSGPNNTRGPDPRTLPNAWSNVQDTGIFYPTTGKMGAIWWDIALKTGNWYKFRIDSSLLQEEWKEYCESGLRFIRQKCYKWNPDLGKNADYEDFFGSGIFYGIGSFAGRITGGTSDKPIYQVLNKPIGYTRDEMIREGLYSRSSTINSKNSGALLPLSAITDQNGNFYQNSWWCDSCLGSIYDRGYDIKSKLEDLKQRQVWDLYSTLACAYCSLDDAAFKGDKKLKELLLSRRKILLSHPDRMKIDINDVLPNEPGINGIKNSDNWREQLLAHGVPKVLPPHNKFNTKISNLDIPKDLKPPTESPDIDAGPFNPWDPNFKPKRVGRKDVTTSNSSGKLILLGGLGAAAFYMTRG